MQLHNLKPRPGARHRTKRVGCGESSGHGKTSGRGHKGQRARKGGSVRVGFEGGQMPLTRKMPRRGFTNGKFRVEFFGINVGTLNEIFDNGATIDETSLRSKRLVTGTNWEGIKLLGKGEITKKITVKVNLASASAVEKIEKAGGKVELVKKAPKKAE
jgi:large subunit ribosomal protein L15